MWELDLERVSDNYNHATSVPRKDLPSNLVSLAAALVRYGPVGLS